MLKKIGILGCGNIGGVLIQEIAGRRLARKIAVADVKPPDLARGKCLDIAEGLPMVCSDVYLEGSKDYAVIEEAEIIINTAGVPRVVRPDGSIPGREELLRINLEITDMVSDSIRRYCPEAKIISIANPLDAIMFRLYQNLKSKRENLMGMAGVLDSSRYRYFVAEAAGVSMENVEAMVLGGHGDTMVPVRSCCRIAGLPVQHFISDKALDQIEDRVRKAGAEVVGMLGTGSAFVSPAWGVLEMVEAIVFDKKKIMPCCVLLQGEYGIEGYFIGVPVVLGKEGMEKIIEIELTPSEKEAFLKSAGFVKETVAEVRKLSVTVKNKLPGGSF